MVYFIVLFVFLIIVMLSVFFIYKLYKEVQGGDSEIQPKDVLLKQQETLTTLSKVQENYQLMLEQLRQMDVKNASSSQILSDMSSHIYSMNNIMVNKKSRGNWGEYQLNTLLSIYAGESQKIFETQYMLKNGYIGDVALHLPGNTKVLIIDSKFPLENYQNLTQEGISDVEQERFISLFKQNIKKHINDISKKYISQETVDEAVMFVPSEAIYLYICAEQSCLIEYAHSKHVLITSPTTLLGVVFTLVNATKDFNRSQHVKDIEKQIISMEEDSKRLRERVEKSQSYLSLAAKTMDDVRITYEKISKNIEKINEGKIEKMTEHKTGIMED